MPLQPGERLGPYEILSPLGAGGMGEVYRARDPRLNRDVAIKVSAAQFSERFGREAEAIAALNHPNICQIYDVGPSYLVMEYIDGAPIVSPSDPRPLVPARSAATGSADRGGARGGTPQRHHPSRPQAGEHPRHQGWGRQAA